MPNDRHPFTATAPDDLAALRHELVSPLAAVTALIGTLTDDDRTLTGEQRREIAQLAYWRARHITAVLTGTATLHTDRSCHRCRYRGRWSQPRLRTELTPDAAVHAHPVQQVLANLR